MISVQIELEDEVKSYEFPTSWDDVTVAQFTRLFSENTPIDNKLMASVKVISALSGIDEKIIMMMDVEDFKSLAENLSFVSTEVNTKETDFIEIDGEKYYLYKDFNKMTTGEIITIETIMDSTNGNIYKVMPQLLCLFLRKKKDNGSFEKFTTEMLNRTDKFNQVKISEIHHIFNFFLVGGVSFNPNMLDSTKEVDQ